MATFDRRQIVTGLGGLAAVATTALTGCVTGSSGGGSDGTTVTSAAPITGTGQPDAAALAKAGPLGEFTLGSPKAPVTIIEYASLTCPHCRVFHKRTFPRLKKAYIDTGKVYFIIREFPIGRSAAAAAVATRCVPEKQYLKLVHSFLANQQLWIGQKVRPDAIYSIAKTVGMSRQEFDKCQANQRIIDGLVWVKQRGREFGVAGTPTFFINGRKVRGSFTFDQMKAMIDPHIA